MKKILFLFTLGGTLNIHSQTAITAGSVYGTWTLAGSPYNIQGGIYVPNDSTLNIQPGVTVNFQGWYKLLVMGRLLAIGTAADTITFTTANISTGWRGICFDGTTSNNDTSKIIFGKVIHGKATGSVTSDQEGGGFYFYNSFSKAIISHCLISNCVSNYDGGAIYINQDSPTIVNSTISNNTSAGRGAGIFCCYGNPIISNNIITKNNASSEGGGIYSCNNTISKNIISYNTTTSWGGGISCGNSTVSDNFISNNTATDGGGLYCSNGNTVSNNVIANNSATNWGGGVFCDFTGQTLINNTITNNHSSGAGGGLYSHFSSSPTVRNCILWGNTATSGAQVALYDQSGQPNFYYCNVESGPSAFGLPGSTIYTGTYSNNLNSNPLFVLPSTGSGTSFNGVTADWSLQLGSPCIDAGDPSGTYPAIDIASNPRVSGVHIDIGAYEYQSQSTSTQVISQKDFNIYPNPTSDQFFVETNTTDILTVDLYDVNGRHVFSKIVSDKSNINVTTLDEGIYTLTIKTADRLINKKLVILR